MNRRLNRALLLTTAAFAALPASAQQDFTLAVDPTQSTWTWSGTTDLGPLQPTNSNQFQISGTTEVTLAPGTLALETGQFTGNGTSFVMPDLAGFVPNPIPIFPPLATIDVSNLTLSFSSTPFTIDAAGNFSTMLTVTALSGMIDVVPLVGTPSTTDLAGTAGAPTLVSGTLTHPGGDVVLDSPQSSPFAFTDPSSGISGSFTLAGTLFARWTCPTSTTYCSAKTNSLGCVPAVATSAGFASWSDPSAYVISASMVLNLKPGLMFYGFNGPATIPFQGGTLCMVPPLRRTPVQFSGGSPPDACTGTYTFDLNAWIQGGNDFLLEPGVQIQTQFWSRDPASTNGTGLTNAAQVVICP